MLAIGAIMGSLAYLSAPLMALLAERDLRHISRRATAATPASRQAQPVVQAA